MDRRPEPAGSDQAASPRILLMAWLATCDGELDSREELAFMRLCRRLPGPGGADHPMPRPDWADSADTVDQAGLGDLVQVARGVRDARQQMATNIARALSMLRGLKLKERQGFITTLVELALADGPLTYPEHAVLARTAAWLGLNPDQPASAHRDQTGRPPPPLDHPELHRWRPDSSQTSRLNTAPEPQTRIQAMRLLGLAPARPVTGAHLQPTDEEIRAAFRRLALENHPDRFHDQGQRAQRAAARRFMRLKASYELLNRLNRRDKT